MICNFARFKRLVTKRDYNLVFKSANKTVTTDFIVLHKKNGLSQARLGLAISKKVLPKAVQRNRIKRILRESFRTRNKLPPIDLVFLAKHNIASQDNSSIFKGLTILWDKLDALYLR